MHRRLGWEQGWKRGGQARTCDPESGRKGDVRNLLPKARSAGLGGQPATKGREEGGRGEIQTGALPMFSEKGPGSSKEKLVQGNQSSFWRATSSQSVVEGGAQVGPVGLSSSCGLGAEVRPTAMGVVPPQRGGETWSLARSATTLGVPVWHRPPCQAWGSRVDRDGGHLGLTGSRGGWWGDGALLCMQSLRLPLCLPLQ